jgi:hypothetical protein
MKKILDKGDINHKYAVRIQTVCQRSSYSPGRIGPKRVLDGSYNYILFSFSEITIDLLPGNWTRRMSVIAF